MGSRRFILGTLAAGVLFTAATGPALGKKPEPGGSPERPLTAHEQAASDRKAAGAERYVASVEDGGGDLVSLACFVPNGTGLTEVVESTSAEAAAPAVAEGVTGAEAPADGEALGGEAVEALTAENTVVAAGCAVPQGFLAVEARDQTFGHYCGPAVGQVIANYSWAMPAGANKFLQGQIAGWMSTDVNGQTHAFAMEAGLERATGGSPRRPANWDWVVTALWDSDRDGWVGDQMHAFVRSNISNSRMPLAIPVKPHDAKSASDSNLASWPRPVASVGHWVAIYGWVGNYDGTDSARMYFTDSSRDEGGATGKFWTPTRRFTFLVLEHTGRFVW